MSLKPDVPMSMHVNAHLVYNRLQCGNKCLCPALGLVITAS